MAELLLELFSEEIPARMQGRAAEDLKRMMTDGLVEAGVTYEAAAAFATPRRLALSVVGLLPRTRATREERKGPRTDAPAAAIEGFLRSTGLTRDQLRVQEDKKGAFLVAVIEKPGRDSAEVIAELVPKIIREFPWPKSMRWGAGSLRWVRPLHSILCILSDEAGTRVVPFAVDGISSGDTTMGHRFLAPAAFAVRHFDDYVAKLRAAYVILDPEERKRQIKAEAETLAFAQGLELVPDEGLLSEVAGLVEWPVPLAGVIEAQFLTLPPEVLRTSMKEHQKYFSLRDPKSGQITRFIAVANMIASDGGKRIIAGNQRVLAARLSDAKFFWENDLRKPLAEMAAPLAQVTYHNKLGSQAARIERLADIAARLAPHVGADARLARRAAELAKADLASSMVYEFPELQGVMGRYYALHAGEDPAVADACRAHYAPLGPTDAVPTAPVSIAVALADKLDQLACFWAIDEKPTGSKDPFALRRAALGVIRIIQENKLRVDLVAALIRPMASALAAAGGAGAIEPAPCGLTLLQVQETGDAALAAGVGLTSLRARLPEWQGEHAETAARVVSLIEDLLAFLTDRLKVALRDQGMRHDVVDAVLARTGMSDLVDLVARVQAVQAALSAEGGEDILAAYRRAVNILTAEEKKDGVEYSLPPDIKFADCEEERQLFAALDLAVPKMDAAMQARDYAAVSAQIGGLRPALDSFFNTVLINSPNQILRRNRLCLLHRIRQVLGRLADFGLIRS